MNKFDILILALIALWFCKAVGSVIIRKKKGKCIGCCKDCSKCKD